MGPTPATNSRPVLELADVFRAGSEAYLRTHAVTTQQRRVLRAIVHCRTAALGSHRESCAKCGQARIAYNSCRNRHCPKCQQHKQLLWTAQRAAELLPIEYFHVIFTLPQQFNEWARRYPRTIYDLLFAAASQSLLALGQRTLGGELGLTAVLHTWGQTLQQHLHLHCIVTGGALQGRGTTLSTCAPRLSGLGRSVERELSTALSGGPATLGRNYRQPSLARELRALVASVSATAWVVYAKRPMCGPQQVIAYLGRYTQRVAIGNSRLLSLTADHVRFRWKDYRAKDQVKAMELTCEEFTRRFLQHVLPPGYVRIRHYGLLASRGRAQRLAHCRRLLQASPEGEAPTTGRGAIAKWEMLSQLCPACRVRWRGEAAESAGVPLRL